MLFFWRKLALIVDFHFSEMNLFWRYLKIFYLLKENKTIEKIKIDLFYD
jgi:hypothetical protein